MDGKASSSSAAEALIPSFKLERLLNQDQASRRITLLGSISSSPALLTIERAAFPSDSETLRAFHSAISNVKNLGDNDIYRWYLASSGTLDATAAADLKLNLIYPCTEQHIKKYSPQGVRMVTETPETYRSKIRPFIQQKRDEGRLNWVFNILDGRTEQEDVILRDTGSQDDNGGFLMLPDLNWDRKTVTSLHLLGLVERRDVWSLRDLQKGHVEWLKAMRAKMVNAVVGKYDGIEEDQLKLYVHYQPTYYHFHIHVVHAQLEAGITQATGKAFGLENLISQLETLSGGPEAGMADLDLTYYVGEASELWTEIFKPMKKGEAG